MTKNQIPFFLHFLMEKALAAKGREFDATGYEDALKILVDFVPLQISSDREEISVQVLSEVKLAQFSANLNLLTSQGLFSSNGEIKFILPTTRYDDVDAWLTKMSKFGTSKSWTYDRATFYITIF